MDGGESEDDGNDVPEEEEEAADGEGGNLMAHGIQWKESKEGVREDARKVNGGTDRHAYLKWPKGDAGLVSSIKNLCGKTALAYFLLMFPWILLETCVTETSKILMEHGLLPMGLGELLQVLGINIAFGIQSPRVRRDAWGDGADSIWGSPQFGTRFGVSKHRYESILRYWRWYPDEAPWNVEADRWKPVRFFIYNFNTHMCEIFEPCWVLVVDESTTKWVGLEEWHAMGCPHITKIARKPENVAIEVRDVACGESEICIFLEIQEGKEAMATKDFCAPDMPAGTAFCLRATESWKGTGRLVLGDSAFASVTTAVQLRKRGLHFTGIVKTASRMFPKKWCQDVPMDHRGDTRTATAEVDGEKLIAHAWNEPGKGKKPRKSLISTCGTTLSVDPVKRIRWEKDPETGDMFAYTKTIPQTAIGFQYFRFAGAINRFNRNRQDGFRLERNIEVKEWSKRMLMSLLGFVGTNAFKGAKLEGKYTDLNVFMEDLAWELLTNELSGSKYPDAKICVEVTKLSPDDFVGGEIPIPVQPKAKPVGKKEMVLQHFFRELKTLRSFASDQKPRATCSMCHKHNATLFCVPCTDRAGGNIVPVCTSKSNIDCMPWHCQLCG
jgi:hypothetical protein